MQTYETLKLDVHENGVAVLTLNRPAKRNCMNPQLTREAQAALDEIRYDSRIRVVVITGAPPAFCAGMDLKEFFTELGEHPDEFDRIGRLSIEWRGRTLRHFPKPTIAMINGYCFGGAFAIVEGCDLAVAADEATFGLSEINFGMFPGGAVSKAMANLLRPRDALLYGLSGRTFNGKRAAEIGLVNYSVPLEDLNADVMALAGDIAMKNSVALKATKDGYRHSLNMDYDAAIAYSSAVYDSLTLHQDAAWKEKGVGDFLGGRYRPGLETSAAMRDD